MYSRAPRRLLDIVTFFHWDIIVAYAKANRHVVGGEGFEFFCCSASCGSIVLFQRVRTSFQLVLSINSCVCSHAPRRLLDTVTFFHWDIIIAYAKANRHVVGGSGFEFLCCSATCGSIVLFQRVRTSFQLVLSINSCVCSHAPRRLLRRRHLQRY